jgi:NADPH:quinone reductase-like Zn-dependent oxidoreductase
MVARGGAAVCFGTTAGNDVTFSAQKFYSNGPLTLHGLILFQEFTAYETAGTGLRRLAELVAAGKLKPHIDLIEPWTNVAHVAKRLTDREFVGKAVLRVGD